MSALKTQVSFLCLFAAIHLAVVKSCTYPQNDLLDPSNEDYRAGLRSLEIHRKYKQKCSDDEYGSKRNFAIVGNFEKSTVLNELFICNFTKCVILPQLSSLLVVTINKTCYEDVAPNPKNEFTVISSRNITHPSFGNISDTDLLSATVGNSLGWLYQDKEARDDYSDLESMLHSLLFKEINKFSTVSRVHRLLLQGVGDVPTKCTMITFCDEETNSCYVYPWAAMLGARFIEIHSAVTTEISSLFVTNKEARTASTNCQIFKRVSSQLVKIHRRKRSSPKETIGFLNFNLPSFRYCGPGTDIEKMDDLGGPLSALDLHCRAHDLDYQNGIEPSEADVSLLHKMWDMKHPLLPLFAAAFIAKNYFEKAFGDHYTSSLYHVPVGYQPSITYFVSEKSAYNFTDHPSVLKGTMLDQKWKNVVNAIWDGYCYTLLANQTSTSAHQHAGNDDNTSPPNPQSQNQCSSGSVGPCASRNMPTESTLGQPVSSMTGDIYPMSQQFAPCRAIISELFSHSTSSFIELQRVCPAGVNSIRRKSLKGYHLLIIMAGDPSIIVLSLSLHSYNLKEIPETVENSLRVKTNAYFVAGSADVNPDVDFVTIADMLTSSSANIRRLPGNEDGTFSVILLEFPSDDNDEIRNLAETFTIPTYITPELSYPTVGDEQRQIIKTYLQDSVIYGQPCHILICEELLDWQIGNSIVPSDEYIIPSKLSDNTNFNESMSLNQCTKTAYAMQIDEWKDGNPTPGSKNDCPKDDPYQIFEFKGSPLQTTAQKVVLNVLHFFKNYVAAPQILSGTPEVITSMVTSVSPRHVFKINERYKLSAIFTPGKKRKRVASTLKHIDSFNADLIKSIIKRYYSNNMAPLVNDVYTEFMSRVNDGNGDQIRCSLKTFRKVLKMLGFKYGKINMRDAILTRPDIVKMRGKYLNEIRINDKRPIPFPVVFLDETWVDTNGVTGKAWVPAKCTNYRERAEYSYKRHKVSRGARIVVLNAGTRDGFIDGVMKVYPVKKKDVTADYHDNVDSKTFIKWFEELLAALDGKGPHLIVIDNAPYHGASGVVKSTEKKHELYKWLESNLKPAEKELLKTEGEYRKFELWEMVKKEKKTRNFYVIDKMAEAMGHKVVRLAPYNCDLNPIELVWKDVKHAIRRGNSRQTIETVVELTKNVMLNYNASYWEAHVNHVKRLEREYWREDGFLDGMYDLVSRPDLVIQLDNEGEDEECDPNDEGAIGVDPNVVWSTVHDMDAMGGEDDDLLDI